MHLPLLSASALDRLAACPPSAVIQPRSEETGDQAETGNIIHEFLRRVAPNPSDMDAALSCVPEEHRDRCRQIDVKLATGESTIVGAEEAYAVDAATGNLVYLGRNIHREYAAQMRALYKREMLETEVCVSLDLESMLEDGTPVATDYKTGTQYKKCSDMWQMKLQAYALAVKYDAPQVLARVVYIDQYGNLNIDEHPFNRMDLDDVPGDLRKIQEDIRNVTPTSPQHPGAHCTYCPALRGCPSQMAIVKAVLDSSDIESAVALMPIDKIGEALGKWKQIAKIAETAEKALKAVVVAHGEVPADEGFVYREISGGGKTYIPADLARGKIIQLGGTEEDIASITKKSKFNSVRRVKA